MGNDWVNSTLQEMGYDGIKHKGGLVTGAPPHTVMVAFDPAQVRSVNAQFDPAKKSSADLLAGIATVAAPLVKTAATGAGLYSVSGGLAPEQAQAFAPDQLNPIQLGSPRPQEYIPRPSPVLSAVTKFAESQNS
jgi:hypothetical protein